MAPFIPKSKADGQMCLSPSLSGASALLWCIAAMIYLVCPFTVQRSACTNGAVLACTTAHIVGAALLLRSKTFMAIVLARRVRLFTALGLHTAVLTAVGLAISLDHGPCFPAALYNAYVGLTFGIQLTFWLTRPPASVDQRPLWSGPKASRQEIEMVTLESKQPDNSAAFEASNAVVVP